MKKIVTNYKGCEIATCGLDLVDHNAAVELVVENPIGSYYHLKEVTDREMVNVWISDAHSEGRLEYAEFLRDALANDKEIYTLTDNKYEQEIGEVVLSGSIQDDERKLEEFKMEINKFSWYNKPTEDEILKFFNEFGNNIKLFCEQRTIKEMKPIERKLFFATIDKLTTAQLVALWNLFIEESAIYGEDSCIIDLKNESDMCFINTALFIEDEKAEEKVLNWKKNDVRYIQWHYFTDGELREVKDIKGMFIAYWGDIYERIIECPSCYVEFADNDGNKVYYLDDVLAPIIRKEIEK